MLHHQDKNRGTLIKSVTIAGEEDVLPVKRILTFSNSDGEKQVWPDAPIHLRIESNYDTSFNVKKEDGAVYGHPVIDPDSDEYLPLEVTVTPYPANSGWALEGEDFDLGEDEGKIYYGTQVLSFDVPKPSVIGYHLHLITVSPEHGNVAEPVTLSFWSVKFSESKLVPAHWWSFDDSDFSDKAGGVPLVKQTANGTTIFTDGVTKKGLQASYIVDGDAPNS